MTLLPILMKNTAYLQELGSTAPLYLISLCTLVKMGESGSLLGILTQRKILPTLLILLKISFQILRIFNFLKKVLHKKKIYGIIILVSSRNDLGEECHSFNLNIVSLIFPSSY